LNFIHRGPWVPQPVKKSLSFNSLSYNGEFAERPFRLAKFTACRKKCAFLSTWRHEVKASDADRSKKACSDLHI